MATTSPNAHVVQHDQAAQEFFIDLEGDERALLRYSVDTAAGSVDFVRTFVPDSQRGQGLAELLVEAGFAWAEQAGLSILTSCWYAELKYQRRAKSAAPQADV